MVTSHKNRPPRRGTTLFDIAELAGAATVSRVINDRRDRAETHDAVLRHVRTNNFTTNRSVRALSVGSTGFVGDSTMSPRAL